MSYNQRHLHCKRAVTDCEKDPDFATGRKGKGRLHCGVVDPGIQRLYEDTKACLGFCGPNLVKNAWNGRQGTETEYGVAVLSSIDESR
jgi:hypothetical protein